MAKRQEISTSEHPPQLRPLETTDSSGLLAPGLGGIERVKCSLSDYNHHLSSD